MRFLIVLNVLKEIRHAGPTLLHATFICNFIDEPLGGSCFGIFRAVPCFFDLLEGVIADAKQKQPKQERDYFHIETSVGVKTKD